MAFPPLALCRRLCADIAAVSKPLWWRHRCERRRLAMDHRASRPVIGEMLRLEIGP